MERVTKACAQLGIKPGERVLIVRISTATLQFFRKGALVKSYVVSTSLKPPSNIKGSMGTPRGLHEIAERIGGGQPAGMVFKSRLPTGRHFSEFPDSEAARQLITSRILWLRGLEPGVNRGGEVDTYDRYVYIHGTNHEERLGEPMSAGCVEMRNHDVIELYDEVRVGDLVWIE
ncbi:L,D-transpeptidase [Opitutus sp. ER46]|uniref:L,D-transpeptidase n=1 Tax=Opitutus sp. ER46 TaxID=2161864 RepID=UPI000D3273E8|nr:L,D-transpeptidase [Opitutus sp. ER46]PTX94257.1 L,D-transpeptidase [Opitutus sp. ER46]